MQVGVGVTCYAKMKRRGGSDRMAVLGTAQNPQYADVNMVPVG